MPGSPDQHHPPLAGFRLLPAPQQQIELFVATEERRRLRAQRLETAEDAAFSDNAPGALRFGKSGKLLRSEILDLEQGADLSARALGNDERVRWGQRLQPGSEVRRLTHNPAFLRGSRADQIADHDQAAGDAQMHT